LDADCGRLLRLHWLFLQLQHEHATAAPLEVQLRSSKDPFIAAQRITDGTMDFGVPEKSYFFKAYITLVRLGLHSACLCYELDV